MEEDIFVSFKVGFHLMIFVACHRFWLYHPVASLLHFTVCYLMNQKVIFHKLALYKGRQYFQNLYKTKGQMLVVYHVNCFSHLNTFGASTSHTK